MDVTLPFVDRHSRMLRSTNVSRPSSPTLQTDVKHSWTGHETFVEVTHPFELSRIDSGSVGVQRIERWTPSIGSEDHQRRPCTKHICTIHICTTHICTTALLHIICTHTHLYTYTSIHHVICTTALLYCTHLHIPPPPPTNHHPCALHLHSTCRWSHLTCTCTAPPCTAPAPAPAPALRFHLHCTCTALHLQPPLHCTCIHLHCTAPTNSPQFTGMS